LHARISLEEIVQPICEIEFFHQQTRKPLVMSMVESHALKDHASSNVV